MSISMEQFTAGFVVLLFAAMVAGAAYRMTIDKNCVQSAIQQNYPADSIKKICR